MIFADKVTQLRKRAGWTQEELAELMDVSRQSVAKWEGAQSIPELNKLLRLSELFGVSMDYLLKDELEELPKAAASTDAPASGKPAPRRVTLAEAHEFLAARRAAAAPLAVGVLLCIISPICLFLLATFAEYPAYHVTENFATGAGMCTLLAFVAVAVALFISVGNKNAQFAYLETELIDTEYGVTSLAKECRAAYKPTYDRCNLIGVLLCVLAASLLFVGVMVNGGDLFFVAGLCAMLVVVGVAVYLFVRVGVVWASFEKLLEDGEYARERKLASRGFAGAFPAVYWLSMLAIYLGASFLTSRWDLTWLIWAVAGVLYPAARALVNALATKKC